MSAGADKLLKVWDVATALAALTGSPAEGAEAPVPKLKATAATSAHDKDINAIAVAPNDSVICTASQDRTAKVTVPLPLPLPCPCCLTYPCLCPQLVTKSPLTGSRQPYVDIIFAFFMVVPRLWSRLVSSHASCIPTSYVCHVNVMRTACAQHENAALLGGACLLTHDLWLCLCKAAHHIVLQSCKELQLSCVDGPCRQWLVPSALRKQKVHLMHQAVAQEGRKVVNMQGCGNMETAIR